MPLSFWTALEVLQSLLICLLIIYGAFWQFIVLTAEHRNRKRKYRSDPTCGRKSIWIFEYIILFVFVSSIITFEIIYNILMVCTQLSTQVEAALITNTFENSTSTRNWSSILHDFPGLHYREKSWGSRGISKIIYFWNQ